MVDYARSTGQAGTMIIRDDGTYVTLLLTCVDPATNIGSPGRAWSGVVNGVNLGGNFTWPSGGGTRVIAGPYLVTASQTVAFGIAATGTQGLGGPTSHSAAITRALPVAPGAPTITRVSDTQHTLNWVRNSTYTSVIVQRTTYDGTTWTGWQQIGVAPGNAATFTDTTTIANRRYVYRVAGTAASGQSTWSGNGEIDTTPAAPTGVAAARSGNDIVVTAANVPPFAVSFDVRDGSTIVGAGVSLPWTHASPNAAVPHTYTVRGKTSSLDGAWSAASNTVQLLSPPNAPTGLSPNGGVRASDAAVRFAWVHNPVDSSVQSAYELRYRVAGTTTWTTLSGTTAAFRDVTLAVGSWEWQARTKGSHPDWSAWSATATTAVVTRPGVAVQQPAAVWSSSVLPVQWSWTQAQGRPQSAWQLELLNGTGDVVETRQGSGATVSVTLNTRLAEGSWTVRVRAATGDVWSVWAVQAFTVSFIPPAPPTVSGLWNETEGGVTLAVASGDPTVSVTDITNVVTNPSFESVGAAVVVRRNFHRNPVNGVVTGGLAQGNTAYNVGASAATYEVVAGWQRILSTGIASGGRNGILATVPLTGATAGTLIGFRIQREGGFSLPSGVRARLYVDAVSSGGAIVGHFDANFQMNASSDVLSGSITPSAEATQLRWYVWLEPNPTSAAFVGAATLGFAWSTVEVGRAAGAPFSGAALQSADPDLTPSWAGAASDSASVLSGFPVSGVTPFNAVAIRSTRWAKAGTYSARIIPTTTSTNSGFSVGAGALPRAASHIVTTYLESPIVNPAANAGQVSRYSPTVGSTRPNVAGEFEHRFASPPATSGGTLDIRVGCAAGDGEMWVDCLAIIAGAWDGPYFDGDTKVVYVDGVPRRPKWDGTPHASTTTTTAFPATQTVRVERSIDDGVTWEQVADMPGTGSLVDWESLSYGETQYRATAITTEGATSTAFVTVPSRSEAVWLSGGPGFGLTARLPFDPKVQLTSGRRRALKQYAGRSRPVPLTGEALSRVVSVSGRITDRDPDTADVDQLTRIAHAAEPVFLHRDPDGRRVYGQIGDVATPRESSTTHEDGWEGLWAYSYTLTETEPR